MNDASGPISALFLTVLACAPQGEAVRHDHPAPRFRGHETVEVLVQGVDPRIDLVVVVDTRPGEQVKDFLAKLPALARILTDGGSDVHVALSGGTLGSELTAVTWVPLDEPQAARELADAVLPEAGRYAPVEAALAVLEDPDRAPGFLRPDSSVHVLAVGDGPVDDEASTPDELLEALDTLVAGPAAAPPRRRSFSVVGRDLPAAHLLAARASGGHALVEDEAGWAAALDRLGETYRGLRTTFALANRPVLPTLHESYLQWDDPWWVVHSLEPAPPGGTGDDYVYHPISNTLELLTVVPRPGDQLQASFLPAR